jgi:hypothetical protein
VREQPFVLSVRFPQRDPFRSDDCLGNRSASNPTGKEATAQKRSLQCPVAMHATSTKSCHFSSGIQTGDWLIVRLQYSTSQVGFQSPQRFAGENGKPHDNQGTSGGIEQAVRLRYADELVP